MALSFSIIFETVIVLLLVPFFSLVHPFELPSFDTFSNWSRLLEMDLYNLASTATQFDFAKSVYRSDNTIKVQNVNGEDILKSALKKVNHLLVGKKLALKKLVDQAEKKFENFQKLNKSMLNLEDLSFTNMKALNPSTPMSFSSRFGKPVSYEQSGVHIPIEIFDGWMGPRYKEAWWHGMSHDGYLGWESNPTSLTAGGRPENEALPFGMCLLESPRTSKRSALQPYLLEKGINGFPTTPWWPKFKNSEILKGLNWSASLDEVFKENFKSDPNLRWQYFGSYFGFMRVYPAFRWPDHSSLPDLFDVRRRSWYIQSSVAPKDVIILLDRSGSVHGPTLDIMKITARALLNSLGENDYVNVAWFNNKVQWVVPCINTLVQATSQIRRVLGDAVEKLTESNLTSYSTALDFAFEEFRKFDEFKKPWVGSNCHKIIMFLSDGGTEWPVEFLNRHCNQSRNGRIKIFTFACGPHPVPTVVLKEMACSTGGYFSLVTALGSVRIKVRDYVKVLSRPVVRTSNDEDMYQWHNFHRDIGGLGLVTSVTLPVFNKTPRGKNSPNLLGIMGIDVVISEMVNIFPKHILGPFGYAFAINTNGFVIFHPRLHDHIEYLEDPPNIYLTDLEGAQNKIKEMETLIINGVSGSLKNITSIVPVGLGHAVKAELNYFYGPIETATFRFGLVLPSNRAIIDVSVPNVNENLKILLSLNGAFLAPWNYCSQDFSSRNDFTIYSLAERIALNYSSCNPYLINRLLWDAQNAFKIDKWWSQNSDILLASVRSRFLITEGGLTIVRANEDEILPAGLVDPLKNKLYKRASHALNFVFSSGKDSRDRVTVAAGIRLKGNHMAGVIGAEIDQNAILQIFEKVLNTGSNENCISSQILHCHLLNDGGTIIATNVKKFMAGDFIGIYDAELLEALVTEKIIKREYRHNHQSWCPRNVQKVQNQATALRPSILKCIYDALADFRWNFIYNTLLYMFSSVSASKKVENIDAYSETINHSCVTRSAWYYYDGVTAHSGVLKCKLGTRGFRVYFLSSLMLMFLVTQPPCENSLHFGPIYLDANENEEFYYCYNRQHYRLRPKKCFFKKSKEEGPLDCGATSSTDISKHANKFFVLAQGLLIFYFVKKKNNLF